ncbi:2,3-bisphosphoglycerate-dependent phosphoglycerate mutase [uncultured archaeon]|nr:2,3-bisphosphoglycerate-dependent phosphoglycerate mutase [uncultured archaeon]
MAANKQKWPGNLVIVRHGESVKNVEKARVDQFDSNKLRLDITERDMDIALSEKGEWQAIVAGKALAKRPRFDVVFVSPYIRCRQTADLMIEQLGYAPRVVVEERLREKEFGVIDNLTRKGIEKFHPDEWERRNRDGKYYYRPSGGESYPDVGMRVHSFLSTLTRDYRGKNVLIVCHSVVVKMFRKLLERMEEKDVLAMDLVEDVKNASVTSYSYDKKGDRLGLKEFNRVFY